MPWGLKRFQQTGQSHFVTFCCYRRRPLFTVATSKRTFEAALERVRRSFELCVYGYVAMPEHVHLLLSEPQRGTLADALKSLKQGVSRCLIGEAEHFWQKRYYDFNIRRTWCDPEMRGKATNALSKVLELRAGAGCQENKTPAKR